jgi:hypothetical protein
MLNCDLDGENVWQEDSITELGWPWRCVGAISSKVVRWAMVSSPSQRTASKHLSQVVKSLRKVGHSSLKTRLAFPCELVMEARLHYLSDARVPLMICPFTKWPLRGTGPVVGWCILFLVRFRIKKFYRSNSAKRKNHGVNVGRSCLKAKIERCKERSKRWK